MILLLSQIDFNANIPMKKNVMNFTYYTQFVKFIFYEILMNSQANYDLIYSH